MTFLGNFNSGKLHLQVFGESHDSIRVRGIGPWQSQPLAQRSVQSNFIIIYVRGIICIHGFHLAKVHGFHFSEKPFRLVTLGSTFLSVHPLHPDSVQAFVSYFPYSRPRGASICIEPLRASSHVKSRQRVNCNA